MFGNPLKDELLGRRRITFKNGEQTDVLDVQDVIWDTNGLPIVLLTITKIIKWDEILYLSK